MHFYRYVHVFGFVYSLGNWQNNPGRLDEWQMFLGYSNYAIIKCVVKVQVAVMH